MALRPVRGDSDAERLESFYVKQVDAYDKEDPIYGCPTYRFFTESKCVTTRWFDEEEKTNTTVSTWDGTI